MFPDGGERPHDAKSGLMVQFITAQINTLPFNGPFTFAEDQSVLLKDISKRALSTRLERQNLIHSNLNASLAAKVVCHLG